MRKDPNDRFFHIYEAAKTIISFEPIDLHDKKTYGAVVYNLQIIGEAAKHAAKSVKTRHPEIPWAKMASFRNYAVHEYFMLDVAAIKRAIKIMPLLKKQLEKIFEELKI